MAVRLEHVAAGCNRSVHALHWGPSGLLAYAAHNAVMVYEPQEARVLGTLMGHTDRVNCVRWLPPNAAATSSAEAALASGAGDGTVRLWLWTPTNPGQPWRLAATLEGHTTPVTSLTPFALGDGSQLLVSTAGDGEVCVWQCGGGSDQSAVPADLCTWQLRQRILVGQQLQDCAALARLPGDPGWLLLALGGVDAAVRLYAAPPGGDFAQVCKLSGHLDWVKSLAFVQPDGAKLLLASASQDKTVRVWAVTQQQQQQQQQQDGQQAAGSGGSPLDLSSLAASLTRYAPKPLIQAGQHTYAATLEAVLIGHEDWVHSVVWQPPAPGANGVGGVSGTDAGSQPPCLLSASMDRTMMLWRADEATGLWVSEESVGDAGANHLGYYTCTWAPDGHAIAAHGFTGALHIWRRAEADGGWLPLHALGGHYGPVVDACWAADGACLLTVSGDQTARITTRLAGGHWCEIARPQVHGHDFAAVAALSAPQPGRYLYASGSEEKVIRVFEAPRAFRDTLAMARGQAAPAVAAVAGPTGGGSGSSGAAALGALLPALGLSNKAVYEEEEERGAANAAAGGGSSGQWMGPASYGEGPDLAPHPAPSAVAGPPLEEHLAQNTLWPEVHKLYGHGNDLYCLAADPLGHLIASACRAQSADTAAIWLWDTTRWTGVAQLPAHTLTVTQLAFSPDGRFLASASRDRTVALFERQPQPDDGDAAAGAAAAGAAAGPSFRLVGRIKAHSRIVWGLDWSPDSRLLATASRDGKVKVWSLGAAEPLLPAAPAATTDCGDCVRSVQFAPDCQPGASYHLAAGLDGGSVQLLRLEASASGADPQQPGLAITHQQLVWQVPEWERHAAAVRRLCWRRDEEAAGGERRYHLASCSDDHSLRIFSVRL